MQRHNIQSTGAHLTHNSACALLSLAPARLAALRLSGAYTQLALSRRLPWFRGRGTTTHLLMLCLRLVL